MSINQFDADNIKYGTAQFEVAREKDIQQYYETLARKKIVAYEQELEYYKNKIGANFVSGNLPIDWGQIDKPIEQSKKSEQIKAAALKEASEKIKELTELLETIKKEPLILQQINKITKDGKHCFIKKADTEIRINACKDLKRGDEVLLHPKTMQIVEHLGRPPLELSPYAAEKIPDVKWSDIGGLENAKENMIEAIELPHTHKELFKHYNKRQIKGILLSGPPGCGKTMLGKAAANSLAGIYGKESSKSGFLYIKGPEILNQYVGATEETIRNIFFDAQHHKEEFGYPAIIFIDECDAILGARGTSNAGGIGNTIVPMFLTEMDGMIESTTIVILATNRPDILDPAIVRDGRIDRKITINRPNLENGKNILRMHLEKVPLAVGLTLDGICKDMADEFYSSQRLVRKDMLLSSIVNGAMLANCVDIAASYALKRDIKDGTRAGLQFEDCVGAIDRIQEQSHNVQHNLEVTISFKETGGG